MSDRKLRELERRWRETGSALDETAYLVECARSGDEHSLHLLETAAFGGSDVARAALGRTPTSAPGFDSLADAAVKHAIKETATTGGARFDVHLLVGALSSSDSFAAVLLDDLGSDAGRVVHEARHVLASDLDWRAPVVRAFEILVPAHNERMSHTRERLTGPEHLLLALLLWGRGEAAVVLKRLGLVYWDTRETLLDRRPRE